MPKERTKKSFDVETPDEFDKTKTRRDWVLTVFGESQTLANKLQGEMLEHVRYLVYQHEICPTTGREHL